MTLDGWFDALERGDAHLVGFTGVGLLDRAASFDLTEDLRGFHPAVLHLDAVILSDACTSDHHMLIRHPVAAGMVALLSHDDGSRIVHPDLASFMTAARRAAAQDLMLEDVDPPIGLKVPDGQALDRLLSSIIDEEERDQVRMVLDPYRSRPEPVTIPSP